MAITASLPAKNQIMRVLREEGYPSYAKLLQLFDIYLTDNPEVVGYMIPDKAVIVLNKELNINQVSTIVRHEILHEYFTHHKRTEKFNSEHPDLLPDHESANIAADFEISNRGYTDRDKRTVRTLSLGDKILKGLVTEDDYPGWENKTFEEMYEEILKERKQDKERMQKLLDKLDKISKKDLEDLEKELEKQSQQSQDSSEANQQNSNQPSGDQDNKDQKSQSDQQTGSNELSDGDDKKVKDALNDIQNDLDELNKEKQKSSKAGGPFDTEKESEIKSDLAKKVAQIREYLSDSGKMSDILADSQKAKQAEKAAKAARDTERRNADPLNMFKLNLNRFVADQLQEIQDETAARVNPAYEDSEFILPGMMWKENKFIPKINVYHDVSGSFSDPAKTEMAMRAIDTLNKYVDNGDIEINVYYFADRVTDNKQNAGGGTRGTPILNHIIQTKPTNVIVITDSDITDCRELVKVPGAVWMLFYGSRSENLMDHLKGKKQNKYYDINW